ncbi:hypothetical protein R50072_16460 [Simiduia litorea]|uniref:hypothetical protein n=1 Tax=Simiduia litorea TaxID=1435348 RepID=UPI0036F30EAD
MKLFCFLTLLVIAPITLAEEIAIPVGHQGISGLDLPKKGLTMTQVESAHGSAAVKHEATGQPPITRWEYDNYIVYFEGDRVIHSVLRHKPKAQYKTPSN